MKNNKTLLQRFLYGIKLEIKLSLLPESVSKFHNHPLVRIFRVLGGVCIILFLSWSNWVENSLFYLILFLLAMLQFLYIMVISIIKIYYLVYIWKNKKLEVRNSPLDHLASSLTFKLAACIKGACVVGAGSATVLGLGFGADKLLEEGGYPPVFKRSIGKQLGNVLSSMGYSSNTEYLELQNKILEIKKASKSIDELNNIIDEMENNDSFIELRKDLKEFKKEFLKEINKEKKIKEINESKILSELKNIRKNR